MQEPAVCKAWNIMGNWKPWSSKPMNQTLIFLPHVLFQTVFLHVVLIIIYHWKNTDVFATEIYHTWIKFIIHNTSLRLCHRIAGIPISSLWRKPIPNGFYGLRWPHFAPKSQVDGWLNHPSQPKYAQVNRFHLKITSFGYQNFRDLTGFVLPIRNITDQGMLRFFLEIHRFMSLIQASTYTSNVNPYCITFPKSSILEG